MPLTLRPRPYGVTVNSIIRAAAFLALLALVLSGCTGIPRSGGVRPGQNVEPGDSPAPVFLPSGPRAGASPESILLGFIDAASSPENKYAVAREFLTPRFSSTWNPDAGVTIDAGTGRSTAEIDEQTMQFSVNPLAEINSSGEYHDVESSSPVPLRYRFAQVGGQWRISDAPNGIVIDESTFADVFGAQELYFYDTGFQYLVPDLRWFPRGAAAPTRIVKSLLAGPSPWLDGAVTTAFPEGTELTADSVQVVARDAKVDLNSEALNADRLTMQRMEEQLTRSLPSGLTVTISVNQNTQEVAGPESGGAIVNPRVDARPLILRDGEFGFLGATGERLSPIAGISDTVVALSPTAVAVAPGQAAAAVLAAGGVYGMRVGEAAELLDPRQGLIPPSIDTFGYVWSVPRARPTELFAYDTAGKGIAVPTPWADATAVRSLKVSRDGTRLIAQLDSSEGSRFVVAAISRVEGAPTRIGEPQSLSTGSGTALDATWIDELTVAALSVREGEQETITLSQVGGLDTQIESAPGARAITGGNAARDIHILTSAGALQIQRGVGWQERIGAVVLVATQQGAPD